MEVHQSRSVKKNAPSKNRAASSPPGTATASCCCGSVAGWTALQMWPSPTAGCNLACLLHASCNSLEHPCRVAAGLIIKAERWPHMVIGRACSPEGANMPADAIWLLACPCALWLLTGHTGLLCLCPCLQSNPSRPLDVTVSSSFTAGYGRLVLSE